MKRLTSSNAVRALQAFLSTHDPQTHIQRIIAQVTDKKGEYTNEETTTLEMELKQLALESQISSALSPVKLVDLLDAILKVYLQPKQEPSPVSKMILAEGLKALETQSRPNSIVNRIHNRRRHPKKEVFE